MPRPTLRVPSVLQVTVFTAVGACSTPAVTTDAAVTDMPPTDVSAVTPGDGSVCPHPMSGRQCLTRCAMLSSMGLQFSTCEVYCDDTSHLCYNTAGQMNGCEVYDNLDAGPYAFC